MNRRLVGALLLGALLIGAGPSVSQAQERLEGPYKFDMKFGPSIGMIDAGGTQFRLGMHFGIGLAAAYNYRIYLDLPTDLGFGAGYTTIALLPGIQVDIRIVPRLPLFIYPMGGIGLGFLVPSCRTAGLARRTGCDTDVALGIRFGAGIKYVLQGRWNFMFEPLSLEFYPGGSAGYTPGFYNLLFGVGINF